MYCAHKKFKLSVSYIMHPFLRLFTTAWAFNSTLDIVVAVDTSSNIQSNDWSLIKSFIWQFVDGFQIANYVTRFGLIGYSSSASIVFPLTQTQSSLTVKTAINNSLQLTSSSSRNIPAAIQLALAQMLLKSVRSYANEVSNNEFLHFALSEAYLSIHFESKSSRLSAKMRCYR